jgi:hypothetical protein
MVVTELKTHPVYNKRVCPQTMFKILHNHLSKPGINKQKKDSSKSLYGSSLGMTSKIHLRPRGQTISEQLKEIQKNLSFPLNSNLFAD